MPSPFPSRAATALLGTLAITAAQAGTFNVGTDRAAFEAALGVPFVVETFGSEPRFPISTGRLDHTTHLDPENEVPIRPGDVAPGVVYSTPAGHGNFFNLDEGGGMDGAFLDGFYGGDPDRRLRVDFSAPVSAFGFDTSRLAPHLEVTITFADLTSATFSTVVTSAAPVFFGFTSGGGADILFATIGGSGNHEYSFAFAVDNFTFTSAVPEPAPVVLMGLGLAVLAARRKPR